MSSLSSLAAELRTVIDRCYQLLSKDTIERPDHKEIIRLFATIDELKLAIVKKMFQPHGKETSAIERILYYLKENLGQVVTGREIAQVAGIREAARRVRELRHEKGGWQISTGMNRADLKSDDYVLESLEQRPEYTRINTKIWDKVLKRDNFTCQNCGWHKDDPQSNNRKFLEIHHKNPVRAQGLPEPDNLVTLCNVCHDAQ